VGRELGDGQGGAAPKALDFGWGPGIGDQIRNPKHLKLGYNGIPQLSTTSRHLWARRQLEGDPTELVDISPLIPAEYEAERSRILSPAELLELHNRFQQMTADYNALTACQKYDGIRPLKKETQLALWISLGTLCRIGELMQGEWKNVDLERQTWFLPSENVKGARGKKQDHHVFLSPFALHIFQELKTLTGDSQWCFPNKQDDGHVVVKVASKQVGDRQARFKNRKALSRRCHDDTLVLADSQTTTGRRITCAVRGRPWCKP
jgi:integrase